MGMGKMKMWKSPISVECEKITKEIIEKQEGYIVEEVRRIAGVTVDKEELVKALAYDREQYKKGYADGKADAVKQGRWIVQDGAVRCSECGEPNMEWNYCPVCGARMEEVTE